MPGFHANLLSWSKYNFTMVGFVKVRKPENVFFKSALLILTTSTNAFHLTNSFCCFSRYQAATKSVAPSFCISTTQNPQFLDSLRQRTNAQHVSFRISLRWPIHIINPVDKTKLSSSQSCFQKNCIFFVNKFNK